MTQTSAQYEELFGYVESSHTVSFDGGSIVPAESFAEAAEEVKRSVNPDGFLYPPIIAEHQSVGPLRHDEWEEVPQSKRGGLLHLLPMSHVIRLEQPAADRAALRTGAAGFLIHLFGFAHGVRCQFDDWLIDGRVQVKPEMDCHTPSAPQLACAMDTGYRSWRAMPARQQQVITNALFLHCRVPSLEFDWERFMLQYVVLDAIYAVARDPRDRTRFLKHSRRIQWLCDRFDVPSDGSPIPTIVALRDDLFHEALWANTMPGHVHSNEAYYAAHALRKLCSRLMLGVLGLTGRYVQSGWWQLVYQFFQVQPR